MTLATHAVGASDLRVSGVCLGGNVFGWTADRETSFEILDVFTAGGGTFIDTADSYSAFVPGNRGGESETIIGEWLASRRSDVVVATKVSNHPEFKGLGADNIRRAVDASLRRLGVDAIDLYYAHFDDPGTPLDDTIGAFGELLAAGKVRYLGVSNYSFARLREWWDVSERLGVPKPVALQPHYNAVERGVESEVLSWAAEHGVGVMPYYALASGFLTGKYRAEADFDGPARGGRAASYATPRGFATLAALDEVATERGVPIAAVALAWLSARPAVVAPIASASQPDQVGPLLAAAALELTPAEVTRIDAAFHAGGEE